MQKKSQFRYLDNSSDLHLSNHLRSEKECNDQIRGECDVHQRPIFLERLWRVHADGDNADEGQDTQQAANPGLVHPVNVYVVVQVLIWTVIRQWMVVLEAGLAVDQHLGQSWDECGLHF